jgi:hypothetical protein
MSTRSGMRPQSSLVAILVVKSGDYGMSLDVLSFCTCYLTLCSVVLCMPLPISGRANSHSLRDFEPLGFWQATSQHSEALGGSVFLMSSDSFSYTGQQQDSQGIPSIRSWAITNTSLLEKVPLPPGKCHVGQQGRPDITNLVNVEGLVLFHRNITAPSEKNPGTSITPWAVIDRANEHQF